MIQLLAQSRSSSHGVVKQMLNKGLVALVELVMVILSG